MLKFLLDESLSCPKAPCEKPYAIAIGVFDGIHRGHKKVISTLVSKSKALDCISCVLTFDRNPKDLFYKSGQKPIQTAEERFCTLQALGVECVFEIQFTPQIKALTGRQFMQKLCQNFKINALVCGKDFSIGNPSEPFKSQDIAEFVKDVTVVDDVCSCGERISSTRIRSDIEQKGKLTSDIIKNYF